MISELYMGLRQKFSAQSLERVPEPNMVMIDETQDKQYNHAAEKSGLNISYHLILNHLLKAAPQEGKALDLCCASAQLLCLIAEIMPSMNFTGVDLSDNMLELARKNRDKRKLSNLDFTKGNMYELGSIPDNTYDLVTWNNGLHHCETPDDVVGVINELDRIVRDDGTLYIFDLCRLKSEDLLIFLLNHTACGLGDYFYNDTYDSYGAAFTYKELSEILERTHLKDYTHVRPVFMDLIQVVCKSQTKNKYKEVILPSLSSKQTMDYRLLKLMMLGKI